MNLFGEVAYFGEVVCILIILTHNFAIQFQLQAFLDDETKSVHLHKVIDYILDGIPSPEEFTETSDFKEIFFLVHHYVSKLYGMTYLTKKVKNDPGSTIRDYITNSDIAYMSAAC